MRAEGIYNAYICSINNKVKAVFEEHISPLILLFLMKRGKIY